MSSQNGQDTRFIRHWLNHVRPMGPGNFIDVGANDGATGSNTLALEELGWKGVLVEPNPEMVVKLLQNRKSPVIGVAAWWHLQPLLLEIPGDSDKHGLARIPGLPRNSAFFPQHFEEGRKQITVPGMTLQAILTSHFQGWEVIDYLSLDCEGAELEALQGIDLSKKRVWYICVEHGFRPGYLEELTDYLVGQGYERLGVYEQDADFVLPE